VPVSFADDSALPLQDGYADLILLSGEENIRQFNENKQQRAELIRLLAADGFIYCEGREYFLSRIDRAEWERAEEGPGLATRFWQTPLNGEMQTAVPLDDAATIAYFLQNKLYSPLLNLPALLSKRVKRFAGARIENGGTVLAPATAAAVKSGKLRPSLKRSLREAGLGLLGSMQRVENLVDQKRPVRRIGFFYGGPRAESGTRPPRYLRSIAREAGIQSSITVWRMKRKACSCWSKKGIMTQRFCQRYYLAAIMPDYQLSARALSRVCLSGKNQGRRPIALMAGQRWTGL
jgi:hypothetical protein